MTPADFQRSRVNQSPGRRVRICLNLALLFLSSRGPDSDRTIGVSRSLLQGTSSAFTRRHAPSKSHIDPFDRLMNFHAVWRTMKTSSPVYTAPTAKNRTFYMVSTREFRRSLNSRSLVVNYSLWTMTDLLFSFKSITFPIMMQNFLQASSCISFLRIIRKIKWFVPRTKIILSCLFHM